MGRIEYRQSRPDELETIFQLRYDVFIGESGEHSLPGLVANYRGTMRFPDDDTIPTTHFVAVDEGRIVAVLSLHHKGEMVLSGEESWSPDQLQHALGFRPKADEIAEVARTFTVKSHRGRGTMLLRLAKVAKDHFLSIGGKVWVTVVKAGNSRSERVLKADNWKPYAKSEGKLTFNFFAKSL